MLYNSDNMVQFRIGPANIQPCGLLSHVMKVKEITGPRGATTRNEGKTTRLKIFWCDWPWIFKKACDAGFFGSDGWLEYQGVGGCYIDTSMDRVKEGRT